MEAPVVELEQAVVLAGRFPALAGLDLEVGQGEVVLVRGPNGAGKSTLLRLCAGLTPLKSGKARVLGHDLAADTAAVRPLVGLLGHASALYEDLTVEDNLTFWSRSAGPGALSPAEALELMQVEPRLATVEVRRLSAGQRRRVSISVVALRRPRLWLLDEPHAGLDAQARDLLDGVVRSAVDAGATAMVVSHELDRAHALADRSVAIVGGMAR